MKKLSDKEAEQLIRSPPLASGILKEGAPANDLFQDWQRLRKSEKNKEDVKRKIAERVHFVHRPFTGTPETCDYKTCKDILDLLKEL